MNDRERRIREVAHQLWVDEGKPDGRENDHWAQASALVDAELAAGPKPAARKPRPAAEKAPAKAASKSVAETAGADKTPRRTTRPKA